ncbi:MAG: SDR family NAD(P)-dependent oxidoreductase [Hyphomicrobiaceae bacterium]
MAQTLTGRAALVTGAAGGFGRVLTRALLESGAQVLASDVSQAGLAALEADLASAGLAERLTVRTLDISMSGACAEAVADLHRRCGSVDILINNGAMGMQSFRADHLTNLVSIDEITPDIWNKFVAVNLSGAWYLTKAAQPHMKAKGWGRIINVTTSFFTMLRGRFHPYGPIKAGLEAMSAGHAAEFASDGITVNVVVPGGPSDTDMVPKEAPYARQDLIQPAQMVAPILWLCSDAGGEVTGSRFVAANWDASLPVAEARAASEAPIAWPDLAGTPVWPGGKPNE